jgi:hypothetical protein
MKVKIYHDHGRRVKIGPLGFFRIGDRLTIRGQERVVATVDLDGMANAYSLDVLEMHDENGNPTRTVEQGLKVMATAQGGDGATTLTPRQREQCKRIAAVGQRLRADREAQAGRAGG